MKKKTSAGGAATAGGMDFQHRVAAWVATHILSEKDAAPLWNLPSDKTLEWLRCETEQPVDDLLVGTSDNGYIFIQIKRTLQLSNAAGSGLSSALDQFVRQFLATCNRTTGVLPSERSLDPARDRLVLITSPSSSALIRLHLLAVLRRLRNLLPDQPLNDAAVNNNERHVLSIVRQHITRSWQRAVGTDPSNHELQRLLSLVYVQVLDMEMGRDGERVARTLFRTAVLRNPDEADKAWARLVNLCANLAANRSGAARSDLQGALMTVNVQIKAPRSYNQDIRRLKEYSGTIFDALAHLAQICIGSTGIKIKRRSTDILRQVAEKNSIVVVGEPGAGKSGALHDLVKASKEGGLDCVFLAVDRLSAGSLAELRAEIGLDHEVAQVLENWPGLQPALLVIDALDAARGDPAGTMIRDLIRMVIAKESRWHVVASIRKFDLRYGVEVKQLFNGAPPTEFQDNEFGNVRHLNIPRLSEDELGQIGSQSPELQTLITAAPLELRELLQIPFNIRLMAELLGTGVATHELTPIRTQLELLDNYWSHRVIRLDDRGDAREGVLRNTTETMVKARALRVDRSAVSLPGSSTDLKDLLSSQVLIEWEPSPGEQSDRYILAFSHHVLFDYTVARLLLRGTTDAIIQRLVIDPELAVVVRPSLLLHFRHLWTVGNSRRQFWELVFRVIQADRIPEVGKLIGPSVAADLTLAISDTESLCNALDDSKPENHTAAEQALRHLFGALLAGVSGEISLVGPDAGPWCQLLERVSITMRPPVAYTVRSLLSTICERPEEFTPEQSVAVGKTARRLLEFSWSQISRDKYLVIHALEGVCRTFESNPQMSAEFIRRCIEPLHLSQYGFEEMPWLAREAKRLIPFDPQLVEEIYCAAFTHQETSEEPTPIGGSRIMSLTSSRQQDYRMALYELAKVFPDFLQQFPSNATRTLIIVIESYIAQRQAFASGTEHEETFEFVGRQARLLTDHSTIWDEGGTYRHKEPFKMLDAFQQYLEKLAEQSESINDLRELVRLFVSKNRLAVLWRRILMVAARYPNTLGREILSLAWAIPILKCCDTTTPAGEFLRVVFPTLGRRERERIERAILTIPKRFPPESREAAEHVRNRLLGCLTDAKFVTQEARRLLEQLEAKNAVPSNVPPVRFETGSLPFGEEEYLKDQGVPVEFEANCKIRELEKPVKEFSDKNLNSSPSMEEVSNILPKLQSLYGALSKADVDGVHPIQRDHGWGCLNSACACIARTDELSCETHAGEFVKKVLLEGSQNANPTYDPKYDAQFDEHPSWGSPAPRIEAAEGLIVLGRHAAFCQVDVLEAIDRLSKDPVPAVRFQISRSLNTLYRTAFEFMWHLIDRISKEDVSRGVLQGILTGPLHRLANDDPDRVADLARAIFDRVQGGPGAETVREFCVGIFTGLYIWRKIPQCGEIVLEIARNPVSYPKEILHLMGHLREPMTYGLTDSHDSQANDIRHRVFILLEQLLQSGRECLSNLETLHTSTPANAWPEQDQELAKTILHLIDGISKNIYFASGAHDTKRQTKTAAFRTMRPELNIFYNEAATIFDDLSEAGIPIVTHNLLETLNFFAPVDPRGVFLRVGKVIQAGKKGGYQYESLAANLMVKLVERYLAEYRPLLREDEQCRQTLIEILDIFVQAGWPSARRITYRLEEIYR